MVYMDHCLNIALNCGKHKIDEPRHCINTDPSSYYLSKFIRTVMGYCLGIGMKGRGEGCFQVRSFRQLSVILVIWVNTEHISRACCRRISAVGKEGICAVLLQRISLANSRTTALQAGVITHTNQA